MNNKKTLVTNYLQQGFFNKIGTNLNEK